MNHTDSLAMGPVNISETLAPGSNGAPASPPQQYPLALTDSPPDGDTDWDLLICQTCQWDDRDGAKRRGVVTAVAGEIATLEMCAPSGGEALVEVYMLRDLDGLWVCPRTPAQLAALPLTDVGNGERFAARYGRDARYSHAWAKWLVYDGRRWKVDDSGSVHRMAKATARGMLREAATVEDGERRQAFVEWWKTSENNARQVAMLTQAASEPGIPVDIDRLDGEPYLLNVLNGCDLRMMAIAGHSV